MTFGVGESPPSQVESCEISGITCAMEEYLSKDGCMEVRTQLETICHREIEAMLLEQNAVPKETRFNTIGSDVESGRLLLSERGPHGAHRFHLLSSEHHSSGRFPRSLLPNRILSASLDTKQCFASLHLCYSAFQSCIIHSSFFAASERFLRQWSPHNSANLPSKDVDDALEETLSISTAFTISVRSLSFTDLSIPRFASLQTTMMQLRLLALFADASELSLPLVEDVIYLLQSSLQRERVTGCDAHCVEQVLQVLLPAFEKTLRSLEGVSDHAWLVVSEKTLTLLDWWE